MTVKDRDLVGTCVWWPGPDGIGLQRSGRSLLRGGYTICLPRLRWR